MHEALSEQTRQKAMQGEHTLWFKVAIEALSKQKYPNSTVQLAAHPSEFAVLLSSQTSLPTRIPSPQTEEQLLTLRIEYPTSQRVHSVDAVVVLKKHVEQLLTTVQSRTHEPETSK